MCGILKKNKFTGGARLGPFALYYTITTSNEFQEDILVEYLNKCWLFVKRIVFPPECPLETWWHDTILIGCSSLASPLLVWGPWIEVERTCTIRWLGNMTRKLAWQPEFTFSYGNSVLYMIWLQLTSAYRWGTQQLKKLKSIMWVQITMAIHFGYRLCGQIMCKCFGSISVFET